MTEILSLYKCNKCGNIVEIVLSGEGTLVCCGVDMEEIKPKSTDGALEKHVPYIEHLGSSHVVKIGEQPHPMEKEHYVQFIEAISKDKRYLKRKYLNAGEEAEMIIKCLENDDFKAREYCNIHGLYNNEGGKNEQ